MDLLTLREAAERTSRSITTLRRYIRSGRLHAEKRIGRFGPEYFVAPRDLDSAGLGEPGNGSPAHPEHLPAAPLDDAARPPAPGADLVPAALYRELQMKHEQLLVQYGMMRAGGLRLLEAQTDLDERQHALELARADTERVRSQLRELRERNSRELRQARLELEARGLEVAALKEKVRGLEMIHRNAATTESIDAQFARVMEQARRVRRADGEAGWPERGAPGWEAARRPAPEADH